MAVRMRLLRGGAIALGLATAACGGGQVSECDQLILAVNSGVAREQVVLQTLREDDVDYVEAGNEMAAIADAVVADLQALELTDEDLQGYQASFIEAYQNTGTVHRQLAAAMQNQDMETFNRTLESGQLVGDWKRELSFDVNEYCGKSL